MPQKISGPDANNSHHAAGSANELIGPRPVGKVQKQNAGARSQPREQIIKSETKRTDDAFQARSDHEERVKIEEKMERPEMKEQRGEHPPVFAAVTDRPRLERAQSGRCERTHRAAQAYFGNEHGDVQRDKNS